MIDDDQFWEAFTILWELQERRRYRMRFAAICLAALVFEVLRVCT